MIVMLEVADQTIPWPERGAAEKQLSERPGWDRRQIPTVSRGKAITIEAMCCGDLAVNLMLDGDEGFAISLAATGWRISHGGRVYARCGDAMTVAEQMMAQADGWVEAETGGYTDHHCAVLKRLTDEAERAGRVLLDRVYPI